jgi:hypothetical protein
MHSVDLHQPGNLREAIWIIWLTSELVPVAYETDDTDAKSHEFCEVTSRA